MLIQINNIKETTNIFLYVDLCFDKIVPQFPPDQTPEDASPD